MGNYLHASFKHLLVYFVVTLSSMISLSHASNPFTSGEFDELFRTNLNYKTTFVYNRDLVLQVEIVNTPGRVKSGLLDIDSLESDQQLWHKIGSKINLNVTYNPFIPVSYLYSRNFGLENSEVNINFQILKRDHDNESADRQSLDDFDSQNILKESFFNYVSNKYNKALRKLLASDVDEARRNAQAAANIDEAKRNKQEKHLLSSLYS